MLSKSAEEDSVESMLLRRQLSPTGEREYGVAIDRYHADTRQLTARRIPLGVLLFHAPIACLAGLEWVYHPGRAFIFLAAFLSFALVSLAQLVAVRRWPALSVSITIVVVNWLEVAVSVYFGIARGNTELLLLSLSFVVNGVAVLYPWGLRAQLSASAGVLIGYPLALVLGATPVMPFPYEVLVVLTAITVGGFGAYVLDEQRFSTFRQEALSTALLDVARALDATISHPEALAMKLADHVRRALGADWVALSQMDADTRVFRVTGFSQVPEAVVEEIRALGFSAADGTESYRLMQQSGTASVMEGEVGDANLAALLRRWKISALLMQAVKREQEMIGVINCCYTDRRTAFNARECELLAAIANQAAVALENARLIDEAQRANRLKSEFVATLSHELRTPLGVIMGYTDLLLDGTCDLAMDEGRDLLERIRLRSRELNDLIQGLLDLSRMETHRLALEVGSFSIGEVVADVCQTLPAGWCRDGVALQWQVLEEQTVLHSDRRKIGMILRNLVHNALKYTDKGSVIVAIEPNQSAHRVVFTVTDTGPGIPQAEQSAIFEMFRQGDSVPPRGGGVGLGLYIVKRLTEALGGQLGLESTEGAGSRFLVSLPMDTPYAELS